MKLPRPTRLFYLLTLAILTADQLTKHLIHTHMIVGQTHTIIPGLFNLTYVANDGAAFGIGRGNNLLMGTIALTVLLLAAWYTRHLNWSAKQTNILAAMIFSGAIGNLIDRIRIGYVIDFLDFHLKGHHWPAFNIADSCITLSVTYILTLLLLHKDPPHPTR